MTAHPLTFTDHSLEALQKLRAALIDLLASVDADATKPQDLRRRFGLNKNLTWKVSKIATATELYSTVRHVPGAAGVEILLRAMEKAGAPSAAIGRVREAVTAFDRMVETHTGDRTTLELLIGNIAPGDLQREQLEQNRKLAFTGNSGTFGVQAQAQLTLNILAPSHDDPSMLDLVQVAGLINFRRLRPDARWPLFRRRTWNDDGSPGDRDDGDPLDPAISNGDGVPFLPEFCSLPIPKLDVLHTNGDTQYELPAGPVGNTAALTCIYGAIVSKAGSAWRDEHDRYCEIGCNLTTPAEMLVFDFFVHETLSWAMAPEISVYSQMDSGPAHYSPERERNRLPIAETVSELGRGAGSVATPRIARYDRLAKAAFAHAGWDGDAFYGFRVLIPYPPIPSVALMRAELPERPA